jgi:alpha-amylase/alpha-mannosidase (GH57 family)
LTKTVALLLGVHAHQPVGNFESVLDDAHVRCYGPFLRVLYQYPAFRFAIHISGWLLEYMLEKYPEDMALLKEMVARDQAELFGAGFTEPVLASIPTRDRVGQITKLSHYLNKKFDETPQGAWLTERVWESTVVPSLADSGIQYVTVDDYHFMCTGKYSHELDGYFSTEEDGRQIDLFPISEALRYRLPFSPAHEVVAYLEELADESKSAAAIYFDDIEKFGIWPETYEWVYERGWLKDFIEGVLNSSIIKPMRYSDYHAMAKTRGVVYLPTASYIEMNEWTLPVPASHNYADLVAQEKYNNRYEQTKPYVRGGIWRNFFMRYPESNWMHKRMLSLSARYHAMPENKKTQAMEDALFESQANDAYWHGLFGGLYLPHLRRAIYNAIIKLEAMLDQVSERPAKEWVDLDLDGFDELFLRNNQLQVVARLDGTASICEFDSYKLHHNFGDTLTRQAEHYHRKVHEQSDGHHTGEGIANPHERVMFKDVITPEDMATDAYRKTMFCDFLINDDQPALAVSYRRPQTTGAKSMDFVATIAETELQKTIHLNGKTLIVHYQASKAVKGKFKVEINLAMPSCNGPAGRFRIADDIPGGFGELHHFKQLNALSLEDEVLGGVVQLDTNVDCDITSHPHYSVSQSEAGFEKIMQALTLELEWDAKQLKSKIEIKLTVQ